VATVPFQALAESFRGDIVERHAQCVRAPCILLNLPLRLTAGV